LSLILFPIYGIFGLAIATSIAGWVNAVLLWGALYFGNHFRIAAKTLRNIALICFASLCMAGILYGGQFWLGATLTDSALLTRLALIGGLIGVAAIVYFALVIATGAIPKDQMKRLLRR
jgi:putative peptidoglycan lipid II flippase